MVGSTRTPYNVSPLAAAASVWATFCIKAEPPVAVTVPAICKPICACAAPPTPKFPLTVAFPLEVTVGNVCPLPQVGVPATVPVNVGELIDGEEIVGVPPKV